MSEAKALDLTTRYKNYRKQNGTREAFTTAQKRSVRRGFSNRLARFEAEMKRKADNDVEPTQDA